MIHPRGNENVPMGPLKVIWIVLAVLALFVLFVDCVAIIGGDENPIPKPTPTQIARALDPDRYSTEVSSKISLPLSYFTRTWVSSVEYHAF